MNGFVVAGFFDQGFFKSLLMLGIAFCWAFALYDLVRRPLGGWKKAIWFAVIIILPILGAAIYVMASPMAGYEQRFENQEFFIDREARGAPPQMHPPGD